MKSLLVAPSLSVMSPDAPGLDGEERTIGVSLGAAADVEPAVGRKRRRRRHRHPGRAPQFLAVETVRHHHRVPERHNLGALVVGPHVGCRPTRTRESSLGPRRAPQFRAGFAIEREEIRVGLAVVQQVHPAVMNDWRRCGAKVEVDGLWRPLLLPEERAVERVAEQADVLAERYIHALAVRERCL